jgi:hypothetical protein
MQSLYMLSVALLLLGVTSSSIVLPPAAGKSGPEKAFVLVHGAKVNEKFYVELATSIQKASPLRLWVGIPSFAIDTPNPLQIKSAVKGSVTAIEKAGNWTANSSDVFLAGHSLGGVFAPSVAASENYAALVEFGSYVTQGNDITTMKQPVLTLGGELDGLTRVSRIALEYQKMATLSADEMWRKPVVVIPGVCHSQFCNDGFVVQPGHDLKPEVSYQEAHETIAEVTAQFLNLVLGHDVQAAKTALGPRLAYTKKLVSGFLDTHVRETSQSSKRGSQNLNWCAQIQESIIAPESAPRVEGSFLRGKSTATPFDVAIKIASQASITVVSPSITASGSAVTVNAVSYAAYGLNPIDISTVPVAATSITCELMSADAIAVAAKQSGAGGKSVVPNLCQAANKAAIALAESAVSQATLSRFQSRGQVLVTKPDATTSTGPTFLAATLKFDSKKTPVQVQGVSLATKTTALAFGGVYECHLLSPAKVIEWMMVDGLPKLY